MNARLLAILTGLLSSLILMLCLLAFFPAAANARPTMQILDIDLQVSPNPISCGSSAEATVTIQTYPLPGGFTEGVTTKLTIWDYDTGLRDGDDPLDHESVTLTKTEGKITATLTLHCQIKDAGCDLYGPAGTSGESGTEVFVTLLGSDVESPHVYVKCQQLTVNAELDMDGTYSITAGENASVTMSAVQTIQNLDHASWKIEYNSSDLAVKQVTYLNPTIAQATSHTINADHILFTLSKLPAPLNLSGEIVRVSFDSKMSPATVWDTTYVTVSDDSTFFNNTGSQLDVCNGGAHSIFIAPNDTTRPVINSARIAFNPMRISGAAGAVTDDFGNLENYLTVALYDENNDLVSQEFANVDGSFTLDKFFELEMDMLSTLMLYNGIGLSSSYQFMPTVTPSGAIALLLLGNKPPTASITEVHQLPPDGPIVEVHALAIDPEGGAVSLKFDWGDGTMTDYGVLQPSGSTFMETHPYDPTLLPATYFIKVQAKDSKGLEGKWSDEHEVTVTVP